MRIMTTSTLNSWEANYLAELLEAQEQTLFTAELLVKLRCAESMARHYYDGTMTAPANMNARNSDPKTSKAAGASVVMRAGSQKHTLLCVYFLALNGLTDEEAGQTSGLAYKNKCCYWKRCSELRQAGLIAPTGETRLSSASEHQQVCAITEAGKRILRQES